MITFYTLVTFLFCHWLFDFFLQTHKMSQNKSKCNKALSQHVGVYTFGVISMAFLNMMYFTSIIPILIFVIVNAVAHFTTDWVTSRATSALYKEERYHDFFVVVGVDQMIHYITLFGTFIWLTH